MQQLLMPLTCCQQQRHHVPVSPHTCQHQGSATICNQQNIPKSAALALPHKVSIFTHNAIECIADSDAGSGNVTTAAAAAVCSSKLRLALP
jgi:hypothetical protein